MSELDRLTRQLRDDTAPFAAATWVRQRDRTSCDQSRHLLFTTNVVIHGTVTSQPWWEPT